MICKDEVRTQTWSLQQNRMRNIRHSCCACPLLCWNGTDWDKNEQILDHTRPFNNTIFPTLLLHSSTFYFICWNWPICLRVRMKHYLRQDLIVFAVMRQPGLDNLTWFSPLQSHKYCSFLVPIVSHSLLSSQLFLDYIITFSLRLSTYFTVASPGNIQLVITLTLNHIHTMILRKNSFLILSVSLVLLIRFEKLTHFLTNNVSV